MCIVHPWSELRNTLKKSHLFPLCWLDYITINQDECCLNVRHTGQGAVNFFFTKTRNMSFVLARNLPIGKVEASIAMAWKHGVEWIIMTTWNNSYLKVNESLHIVPLKIVEIIQTGATGPLDIVLVCKKLGHSSSTWIIYNYTYLWCQSPRQFDFCSLILFLKYVPKMIWIRKVTYRLPIIHVDSNFERRCETANGSLCFSM